MTKLQYINLQATQYTFKQKLCNVVQCAIIGFLFTSPAWAYLLD